MEKTKKIKKPETYKATRRVGRRIIYVNELRYPPSLKHFIKEKKCLPAYKPNVQNIRQATIDILLNNK